MPSTMSRASFANSPPSRSSARTRRLPRTSATNTMTVKQKMSAITISDSSDPVVIDPADHTAFASNRVRGGKGKGPMQPQHTAQAADNDSGSDITEYEFCEEDFDLGTDEDDEFSDNQSVISVESSDDGNSAYALATRPWTEFGPSMRKQWEYMYCMVCVHRLHDSWEMTELYQLRKDDEMLAYMKDYPLPQWLIPQDEAKQAYTRLMERTRWRNLGISIYSSNVPSGREPHNNTDVRLARDPHTASSQRLPDRRGSSEVLPKTAQQQTQESKNVHQSSVAQQAPPQQTVPSQPLVQPASQQHFPQHRGPQQNVPAQNMPQQGGPPTPTPQAQQTVPPQRVPPQGMPPQMPAGGPQGVPAVSAMHPPNAQPGVPPPGMQYPYGAVPGMPPPGMYYPPPGMPWPQHPHYGQQHPQPGHQMHPYPYQPSGYGHPGMAFPAGPPAAPYYPYQPQPYKYVEPAKRRPKKETPPPQSPPPPPQTPPYAARKRPIEKKPGNKPGRKSTRKHAEAEEFPWTRKLDFKEAKAKARWDLSVYDQATLNDMAATRSKNIAVIEDIDAKIQEQQRKRLQEKNALAKMTDHAAGIARAAKKAKEKAGNPSEVDGKKVRQKREGRPKGDVGGDPYHSGVFAFATPEDQERAAHLGFTSPEEVIDNAEDGKVEPEVQASIQIYWDPGKKGMTENLEQAKFSVRDTVVTRKQLEKTPILTKVAAECIVDFCPDMLWRSMLLRITSEAGCGNKDVRDRFCHNGCYCDKATITKRISAALGQKQTQPKSKGYQPGEWEWYDENVKDFSKYIDFFGMRTSHRNMLKITMAGEKRKRETDAEGGEGKGEAAGEVKEHAELNQQTKLVDIAPAPQSTDAQTRKVTNGHDDMDAGNESAGDSDDSNAVSLQDSDVLDKMEE